MASLQPNKNTMFLKLYTDKAIAADQAFQQALASCGLDRFETLESEWPQEVREAYAAKLQADAHFEQAFQMRHGC